MSSECEFPSRYALENRKETVARNLIKPNAPALDIF